MSLYPISRPHGVMFHHFMNDVHPWSQGAITADTLVALIDFVGRKNILSADEWLARATSAKLENNHLCFTLDDSLLCQFDVAWPVMQEHDITGFFFVYSSVFEGAEANLEIYRFFRSVAFDSIEAFYLAFFDRLNQAYPGLVAEKMGSVDIDRYMEAFPFFSRMDRQFRYVRDNILSVEQYEALMDGLIASYGFNKKAIVKRLWMTDSHLKELVSDGNVIGLHSYSHPMVMERLALEEQSTQYQKNFDHIKRVTAISPTAMSHPVNSYNQDSIRILRNLGIRVGFRANMAVIDNPSELEWPRQDHVNIVKMFQ